MIAWAKTTIGVAALICAVAVGGTNQKDDNTVSVKNAPPVVVLTVPQAGNTNVDAAATKEIKVTYSKDMADGTWSWSTWGEENFPKTTGKPHYLADKRTCVLPIKLEPGHTYAIWLNSDNFGNFSFHSTM